MNNYATQQLKRDLSKRDKCCEKAYTILYQDNLRDWHR